MCIRSLLVNALTILYQAETMESLWDTQLSTLFDEARKEYK